MGNNRYVQENSEKALPHLRVTDRKGLDSIFVIVFQDLTVNTKALRNPYVHILNDWFWFNSLSETSTKKLQRAACSDLLGFWDISMIDSR